MKHLVLAALATIGFGFSFAGAAEELELIETPRFDDVKRQVLDWVSLQKIEDKSVLEQVAKLWVEPDSIPPASELMERTIRTFAIIDSQAAELVNACHLGSPASAAPSLMSLDGPQANDFYKSNLTQHYAVYLVRSRLYDESLLAFELCDIEQSVDPPSLLFHRAVAQSQLLMKEEGLATLETLTKKTEAVPQRYMDLANLMQFDLNSIEDESLDEVAHRMRDVGRRLSLGRGGQKTQKKEDEIITLLDEIIKKAEQSNSGASGQGNGGNSNNPGGGAQESVVKGQTAPGETDEKNLKKQAGWGALPDAEVTKAKNLIKRDFPEHYRRAIEAYFRKSAGRKAP